MRAYKLPPIYTMQSLWSSILFSCENIVDLSYLLSHFKNVPNPIPKSYILYELLSIS